MEPLYLRGCRHDILGHYLKAIGLLRVLARCADQDHRDPDAEGWWDMDQACFCLRSEKYPTMDKLVEFLEKRYRPTPVMAAWNKEVWMKRRRLCSASIQSRGMTTGRKIETPSDTLLSPAREIAAGYASRVVSVADKKKQGMLRKSLPPKHTQLIVTIPDTIWPRYLMPWQFLGFADPVIIRFSWRKGSLVDAHLWRSHWEYLGVFAKLRKAKKKDAVNSLIVNNVRQSAVEAFDAIIYHAGIRQT